MNIIYNIVVNTVNNALKLYSLFLGEKSHRKFSLFVKGQRRITERIADEMSATPDNRPRVWFHAASLGEYAVARPLIARLKRDCDCSVVLTFFSPSGYRALKDNHPEVDHLFYLPLDTKKNVRAFLDAVHPDKAVFVISEYWPNYLQELKFRAIPTYLVSAIIRDNSPFFRRYGRIYRKSLSAYTHFYVLDERSRFNLSMLGQENITVSGDPLFDNADIVARTPWTDDTIGRFVAGNKIFMAGSISDAKDLELVSTLANRHPDTRFIFVPHDITTTSIDAIKASVHGGTLLYSECNADTDMQSAQILIIDFVGRLAYMYRYATWAYVGGGFTPLLHSVIEATVYGLPVAFGPQIHRKVTPKQLIELGIGQTVNSADELDAWFKGLKNNPERIDTIKAAAADYVASNVGATGQIVKTIEQGLWAKK